MIIWGWGHQTVKNFGNASSDVCGHCNNYINFQLLKITTWFTLFFIPIIPYRKRYLLVCPICKASHELQKEEFMQLAEELKNGGYGPDYAQNQTNNTNGAMNSNDNQSQNQNQGQMTEEQIRQRQLYEQRMREVQEKNKYAGKTETQIAYLKQMEEIEQSRQQHN